MNGFIKKRVGTLTLGEKLKKLRSDRRISLSEVSRATKVQVKYLEYLEEGKYEALPADVYVKGFLRSYAEFLGVEERIFIRSYEKERGIIRNLEKDKKPNQPKSESIKVSFFSLTPKRITLVVLGALALSVIVFIYREIGSFASSPRLIITSPENNLEINDQSVEVSGVTDKDSQVSINGQAILIGDDGKFKEKIILQFGNNTIDIRAVNRFDKFSEETLTIKSNYSPINSNSEENQSPNNLQPVF